MFGTVLLTQSVRVGIQRRNRYENSRESCPSNNDRIREILLEIIYESIVSIIVVVHSTAIAYFHRTLYIYCTIRVIAIIIFLRPVATGDIEECKRSCSGTRYDDKR